MASNRKQTKSGSTIRTGIARSILDVKKSAYDKPNPVSHAKDNSSSIDFKAVMESQRSYTLPPSSDSGIRVPFKKGGYDKGSKHDK